MHQEEIMERLARAIDTAARAWDEAHRGLPSNPMTKAAAIPATGIIAVTLLDCPEGDEAQATARVVDAITIARRAWALTHDNSAGNPIAATAEKSVIGILAAGVLDHLKRRGRASAALGPAARTVENERDGSP